MLGDEEVSPAMNTPGSRSKLATAYYGLNGGIAPLFSCGAQALAPSYLTGDGSHMGLWVSVVVHLAALALNVVANFLFFVNSGDGANNLLIGWAIASLTMHSLGVVGAVVSTGLIKDSFATPLVNTVGAGLFLCGLLATAKISYAHDNSLEVSDSSSGTAVATALKLSVDSGEDILYNLSLFFQSFGIASLLSNALCAISMKGGI